MEAAADIIKGGRGCCWDEEKAWRAAVAAVEVGEASWRGEGPTTIGSDRSRMIKSGRAEKASSERKQEREGDRERERGRDVAERDRTMKESLFGWRKKEE